MGELIDETETETESIEVRKKRILNASTTAYTYMRTYSISCVALHIQCIFIDLLKYAQCISV